MREEMVTHDGRLSLADRAHVGVRFVEFLGRAMQVVL